MWLDEYRCDGLRFDSANDLPWDYIPEWTSYLHDRFTGCLLIAEITPENPEGIHRLGFDSLWTHSGYFGTPPATKTACDGRGVQD